MFVFISLVVLGVTVFAVAVATYLLKPRPRDLANDVVVITGAALGVGRCLTDDFLAAGCTVVMVDLRAPELEAARAAAVSALGGAPRRVYAFPCDVGDAAAVREMQRAVAAAVAPRRVSVLVNCAGIVIGGPLLELTDAQVERTLRVNTLAHFYTTRAFLPAMIEARDGVIVSIASAMGLSGAARLTDYCASKWAAVGFMEALRQELRQTGVSTLTVCPFAIDTGMFAGIYAKKDALLRRLLLPILKPAAVSRAVVAATRAGDDAILVLPRFLWWVNALTRMLPVPLYDALVAFAGGAHGMEGFKGRGVEFAMFAPPRDGGTAPR